MCTGAPARSCWRLSGMASCDPMIANYHAHTWRCNHAVGREEDYVQAAIGRGLKIFGFSDHTPYPFPWYYYSWFRMMTGELGDYTATIWDLKQRYRDSLEIHIGLEAEYYPGYFPELVALLRDHPVEYLILGQHFLDNEMGAHGSSMPTGNPELLTKYCRQTMDAMHTGLYTYFAHPDIFNFTGDRRLYQEQIRRLCREARSCGIPLEMNLLGMEKGKHYPNRTFWEIAAEEGCQAVLGCDTHDSKALADTRSEENALAMVRALGMELLETVPLRPIR